jgi:hypothetical protein
MKQEVFLKNLQMDNNDNHRVLLWKALEATSGTVIELGSGWGSTEHLRNYCKEKGREFLSFDNGEEWAKIHGSTFVPDNDWDSIDIKGSVLLLDHAPGERRGDDLARFKDKFEIIVAHDTEPVGAGNYGYEKHWKLFKYRADVKTDGAWATAVSNTIDLKDWKGFTAIGNGSKAHTIS